ncbi:MAG: lysophospholipid acyltransferase family protein [Steroidobacteraceae bacterium]
MSNPFSFALRLIYGCYVWWVLVFFSLLTLLLLLLMPGIDNRRVLAHRAARAVLAVTGIRFEILNPQLLPKEPCVVVANHCSYLDGLLMKAALPARFSFVIKKEMVKVPLAGLLLKRIGSLFVDRANRHASGMDARRIMREAVEGKSLVFFPEGTFTSRVGLQAFHLGAFATAQRASLPVVPVAIHGTRRILRPGSPWPRPGVVEVEVLGTLSRTATSKDRTQIELLRDQARARILMALSEPDLLVDTATEIPTETEISSVE